MANEAKHVINGDEIAPVSFGADILYASGGDMMTDYMKNSFPIK